MRLIAARRGEKTERGVIAQAGIDGEGWPDTPGIFRVEPEAAKRLRECAITVRRVDARGIGKRRSAAIEIGDELRGIVQIKGRILGELDEMFSSGSECAAKDRFMDEIDAEAQAVPP